MSVLRTPAKAVISSCCCFVFFLPIDFSSSGKMDQLHVHELGQSKNRSWSWSRATGAFSFTERATDRPTDRPAQSTDRLNKQVANARTAALIVKARRWTLECRPPSLNYIMTITKEVNNDKVEKLRERRKQKRWREQLRRSQQWLSAVLCNVRPFYVLTCCSFVPLCLIELVANYVCIPTAYRMIAPVADASSVGSAASVVAAVMTGLSVST